MLACLCRLRRAGSRQHRPPGRSRPEIPVRTGCEVHARLHPRNVRRQSFPVELSRCVGGFGFGFAHLEVPGAIGQTVRGRPSGRRPGLPALAGFSECSLRATFANGCDLRLLARGIGRGTSRISRGSRRRHIADRSGGESTRPLNSPAGRRIFPVLNHREFGFNPLENARESRSDFAQSSEESAKFPVLSLLNRDPPVETGSPETLPTAIESPRAETFAAQSQSARKNTRFHGVLGVRLCAGEPETDGS